MVVCSDCCMRLKSRKINGSFQVYDTDNKCWIEKCPNCSSSAFTIEDEIENNYCCNDDY